MRRVLIGLRAFPSLFLNKLAGVVWQGGWLCPAQALAVALKSFLVVPADMRELAPGSGYSECARFSDVLEEAAWGHSSVS